MRQVLSFFVTTLVAVSSIFWVPDTLKAQSSIWIDERHDKKISIEFLLPDFNDDGYCNRSGWITFLGAQLKVGNCSYFVFDFPITYGKKERNYYNYYYYSERKSSETAIGNPYLGMKFLGKNPLYSFEFGARFPLASNEKTTALATAMFTDIDRLEAFMPDYITIQGMINFCPESDQGFHSGIRIGPKFWIYTGEYQLVDDVELNLHYNMQARYTWQRFSIGGGITGIWCLTEEYFMDDDRFFQQLGFEAGVAFDHVYTGFSLRLPADNNLKNVIDMVFGFNIQFNLY